MKKLQTLMLILLYSSSIQAEVDEMVQPDYAQIIAKIQNSIKLLQKQHPVLMQLDANSESAQHSIYFQHQISWKLDDPSQPHSKLNGKQAVYQSADAFWFSIQFYQGPWQGAAVHRPHRFGDLRVWLSYGYNKDASVIESILKVIDQAKSNFYEQYPELILNNN